MRAGAGSQNSPHPNLLPVRGEGIRSNNPMPQSFTQKVLKIVSKIPRGKTMTYGEVAELAGSSGAARAVGSIMKYNYDPTIPCHRVIRSDGTLGQYNKGVDRKEVLLKQEGAI